MQDNPYAAPQTVERVTGVLSGSREDLRKVAAYQKGILSCISVYLAAVFSQFVLPFEVRQWLMIAVVVTGVIGAVFVFRLSIKLNGTVTGIIYGILTFVPLVGMLMLLIVNGKATRVLKENGIRVGLFGADVSSI